MDKVSDKPIQVEKVGTARLSLIQLCQHGAEPLKGNASTRESPAVAQILDGFSLTGLDEAGAEGARAAYGLTRATGYEWGGLVYEDGSGKFRATPPITDKLHDNVESDEASKFVPRWGQVKAAYHSHTIPYTRGRFDIDTRSVGFSSKEGWYFFGTDGIHGVPAENPTGDNLSGDDKQRADLAHRPEYMSTPNGDVRVYEPLLQSDFFDEPQPPSRPIYENTDR